MIPLYTFMYLYATNLNEIHPYLSIVVSAANRSQVDGGRDVHGCLGGDLVLFHVQAGIR
jgi:hypothetical protein